MGGGSTKEAAKSNSDNENKGVLNGNSLNNSIQIENIDNDLVKVEYLLIAIIILLAINLCYKLLKAYNKSEILKKDNQRKIDSLIPPQPRVNPV